MPEFVSAREAVSCIKSGDFIGVNTFLTLINPFELLEALAGRFEETGEPNNLTMFCETGFGNWEENSPCERIITSGGVKSVILSHYATMPGTAKMVLNNEIEGYNLLFGAMSHMVREAAGGKPHYITKSGVNLFVDPRFGGSKLNARAQEDWVSDIVIDGERYLKYKTPTFDIALIKGTSCDRFGNITMEKESCTLDAMSLAQATKRTGGKVIVQVEHFTQKRRPWECIVPGALVDYIVLCPEQKPILGIDQFEPSYAGERFMSSDEITEFVLAHGAEKTDEARAIITKRAVQELKPGMFVNIGIGVPEGVAVEAAKKNLLSSITLTVEDGAIGGMPASGKAFGSAVGAHCIINAAQMFDFYDGGGLDICFLGALEFDKNGHVNSHYNPQKLSGIGGFANISQNAKKVVFCTTFTAGGLQIENRYGKIRIVQEGRVNKLVEAVHAISFSAKNAHLIDQEVLYVTERCVFRLAHDGLVLTEVYDGIDLQKDILDKVPFDLKVCLDDKA
ncbi:MAG: CoA-transferase [Oscillospiraceae bacterium]